jgi:Ca2+-binding RTX toxin-like protein
MGGGIGDDTYIVNSASDVAFEVAGQGTADTVRTSVSYAVYFGWDIERLETSNAAGVGALNLTGSANANTITGNAGANILNGGAGADTLIGLAGNDFYIVDNGLDVITEALGGGTADHVRTTVSFALAFDDDIEFLETVTPAAATALNLFGNELAQVITGNAGVNVINARGGNDVIVSGYGNDIVAGGLGNDVFRFNALINAAGNRDTITDFNVVNDTMQLENTGAGLFTLLPAGGLAAALFKANATGTATDADDRIVYNTATGALFYDINGSAAGGATQFATIANKAALTNADFVII